MKNGYELKIEVNHGAVGAVKQIVESCGGLIKQTLKGSGLTSMLSCFKSEAHSKFCKHLLLKRHDQVINLNDIFYADEDVKMKKSAMSDAEICEIIDALNGFNDQKYL